MEISRPLQYTNPICAPLRSCFSKNPRFVTAESETEEESEEKRNLTSEQVVEGSSTCSLSFLMSRSNQQANVDSINTLFHSQAGGLVLPILKREQISPPRLLLPSLPNRTIQDFPWPVTYLSANSNQPLEASTNNDYLTDTTTADGQVYEEDAEEEKSCYGQVKKVRFRTLTEDSIFEYEKFDWQAAAYEAVDVCGTQTLPSDNELDIASDTNSDSEYNGQTNLGMFTTIPLICKQHESETHGRSIVQSISMDLSESTDAKVSWRPKVATPSNRERDDTPHPVKCLSSKTLSRDKSWSDEGSPFFPDEIGHDTTLVYQHQTSDDDDNNDDDNDDDDNDYDDNDETYHDEAGEFDRCDTSGLSPVKTEKDEQATNNTNTNPWQEYSRFINNTWCSYNNSIVNHERTTTSSNESEVIKSAINEDSKQQAITYTNNHRQRSRSLPVLRTFNSPLSSLRRAASNFMVEEDEDGNEHFRK